MRSTSQTAAQSLGTARQPHLPTTAYFCITFAPAASPSATHLPRHIRLLPRDLTAPPPSANQLDPCQPPPDAVGSRCSIDVTPLSKAKAKWARSRRDNRTSRQIHATPNSHPSHDLRTGPSQLQSPANPTSHSLAMGLHNPLPSSMACKYRVPVHPPAEGASRRLPPAARPGLVLAMEADPYRSGM